MKDVLSRVLIHLQYASYYVKGFSFLSPLLSSLLIFGIFRGVSDPQEPYTVVLQGSEALTFTRDQGCPLSEVIGGRSSRMPFSGFWLSQL